MESASWQRPLHGFEISQNQAKMSLKSGFSDGLGGAFFRALRTLFLLSLFVVGFLFAACEANELILPTTKNLGNALYKYGIVQIGSVVFKTEWTQRVCSAVSLERK